MSAGRAGFRLDGLDELMNRLSTLGEGIDGAMQDAVQAGGEVLTEELTEAIHRVVNPGRGYSRGILEVSVKDDGIRNVNNGVITTIYPHGTDTHGGGYLSKVVGTSKRGRPITRRASAGGSVRNYDKLYYLEHGTARQAATPFMTAAINSARPKVMQAMQQEIDEAIRQAGGS